MKTGIQERNTELRNILHKMPAASSSWTPLNSSSLVPVEPIRAPEIDAGFRTTLGYLLQFGDICMKRWIIPNHRLDPQILGVLIIPLARHKPEEGMLRQTILETRACPAFLAEQVLWDAAQG